MKASELSKTLGLVKPALSNKDFIPVLKHFCFTDDSVYAYDDRIACVTKFDSARKFAVNGDTFYNLIKSYGDAEINLAFSDKLTIKSGKSNINLPILDSSEFIFEEPEKSDFKVGLNPQFFEGFKFCMSAMSTNMPTPQMAGMTLFSEGKELKVFASDSETISQYCHKTDVAMSLEAALPAKFWTLAYSLYKHYDKVNPVLHVYNQNDMLMLSFNDETKLYSKFWRGVPVDFSGMIEYNTKKVDKDYYLIPDSLTDVLKRCSIVSKNSEEMSIMEGLEDKIGLYMDSKYGSMEETIPIEGMQSGPVIKLDPNLALRAIDSCETMFLVDSSLILKNEDKNYTFLVSVDQADS